MGNMSAWDEEDQGLHPNTTVNVECPVLEPPSSSAALHCLQTYLVQLDLFSPAFVPLPEFSP